MSNKLTKEKAISILENFIQNINDKSTDSTIWIGDVCNNLKIIFPDSYKMKQEQIEYLTFGDSYDNKGQHSFSLSEKNNDIKSATSMLKGFVEEIKNYGMESKKNMKSQKKFPVAPISNATSKYTSSQLAWGIIIAIVTLSGLFTLGYEIGKDIGENNIKSLEEELNNSKNLTDTLYRNQSTLQDSIGILYNQIILNQETIELLKIKNQSLKKK